VDKEDGQVEAITDEKETNVAITNKQIVIVNVLLVLTVFGIVWTHTNGATPAVANAFVVAQYLQLVAYVYALRRLWKSETPQKKTVEYKDVPYGDG
jgi:hypothetical protein